MIFAGKRAYMSQTADSQVRGNLVNCSPLRDMLHTSHKNACNMPHVRSAICHNKPDQWSSVLKLSK